MENLNIIICGVVKNCRLKLDNNIRLAIETGKLFNTYKIVIYENNSTDGTKEVLQNYKSNPYFKIISEDIDYDKIKSDSKIWTYTEITGSDAPCRIEQICNSRNKVIEEINSAEYERFNYVIWIDLDSNGWLPQGIINSFYQSDKWDIVYANGIDNNKNYYDLYAYRGQNQLFGPEIIGEVFWTNMRQLQFNNNMLLPVYSAFGGIGIFKKNIFKTYKYDCIVNDAVKYYYYNLLSNISLPDNIINCIKNIDYKFPSGYMDKNNSIFWKSNSGYKQPVVCEHVCLNLSLINNGYKIYINPKMIYFR